MSSPQTSGPDSSSVLGRLKAKLTSAGAPFTILKHAPVFSSEQAAAARGTPLSSGAKALIVKVDDRFMMFVLPADRRLDSRKLRAATGARRSRFATPDEVLSHTALEPGSIPPFGSLFGLNTCCDPSLAANPSINFNAADHAVSISMAYSDFIRVEQPAMLDCSSL